MNQTVSMHGTKIRLRPSSYYLSVGLVIALIFFVFSVSRVNRTTPNHKLKDEHKIDLIDLFTHSARFVQQAGNSVRSFKYSLNNSKVFQKTNLADKQSTEPLTLADVLSHSIITDGLKRIYKQLEIVSEEKSPVDKKEIDALIAKHLNPKVKVELPRVKVNRQLTQVPLSSVAVWVDPLDATQEFTENLLEYVMVMICVTVDQQPTIGMVYAPFTNKFVWGWVDLDHSTLVRDRATLRETHRENVDEIVISRSHAGRAHEVLKDLYRDIPYKIIPAAGSGYKSVHVIEEYSDYYLHLTPIKKWDLCAPDALIRSFNGKLTTLKNRPISYDHRSNEFVVKDGLLLTYKRNHSQILKIFDKLDLKALNSSKSPKKNN